MKEEKPLKNSVRIEYKFEVKNEDYQMAKYLLDAIDEHATWSIKRSGNFSTVHGKPPKKELE